MAHPDRLSSAISRRKFLKLLTLLGVGAVAAACTPQASQTSILREAALQALGITQGQSEALQSQSITSGVGVTATEKTTTETIIIKKEEYRLPTWWPTTPEEAKNRWTPEGDASWWQQIDDRTWVMEAGDTRTVVDTSRDDFRTFATGWDPDFRYGSNNQACGLRQGRYLVETGAQLPNVVQAVIRAVDEDPNQQIRAEREAAINLGADFLVNEPNLDTIAFAWFNHRTNRYDTFIKVGEFPFENNGDTPFKFPLDALSAKNRWTPNGTSSWWQKIDDRTWVMEAGEKRTAVDVSRDGNLTYATGWNPDFITNSCGRRTQGLYIVGNDVVLPNVVQAVVRDVDRDPNQTARALREVAINLGDFLTNEPNLMEIAFAVANPKTGSFQTFVQVK